MKTDIAILVLLPANCSGDLGLQKLSLISPDEKSCLIADIAVYEMHVFTNAVINGYQFIKQVKEIRPQVKLFFMSAFEVNRMELPFVDIDEFIQKPILLDDLIKTVCKHMNS